MSLLETLLLRSSWQHLEEGRELLLLRSISAVATELLLRRSCCCDGAAAQQQQQRVAPSLSFCALSRSSSSVALVIILIDVIRHRLRVASLEERCNTQRAE